MKTLEARKAERRAWIGKNQTTIYKDIEILSLDRLSNYTGKIHHTLTIWRGTAGKPFINYYYRTAEQRNNALDSYKKQADRRAENKKNSKRTETTAARVSKRIKAILKKDYPSIKFSVRSENFAGGDAVRVSWENGPKMKEIEDFTDQFKYGHFDGMQDMYVYSNSKDFDQVKYITTSRSISEDVWEVAFDYAKGYFAFFEGLNNLDDYNADYSMRCTARQYLARILHKMDLTNGFDVEAFKIAVQQY